MAFRPTNSPQRLHDVPLVQPRHVEHVTSLQTQSRKPTTASIWLTGSISHETAKHATQSLAEIGAVEELHVYICSTGGLVRAMIAIMDAIANHPKGKLFTHAVGTCESAAAVIFLMGDVRTMTPQSALMLHPVHKNGDFFDDECVAFSETIVDLFATVMAAEARENGIPEVPREEIREWQHRTTYFDAAHATRLGLCTSMDFESTEVVGVDITNAHQPFSVNGDFHATEAFDAERARRRGFKVSAPVATKTPSDWSDVPDGGWKTRLSARPAGMTNAQWDGMPIIEFPKCPARLQGFAWIGADSLSAIVDRHNGLLTAGPMSPVEEYRARQSQRLLQAVQRIQHGV